MRLIDADALKEVADRVGCVVSEDIDAMPTIEPKKGEWHKRNNVNYSPFDNSTEYLYSCGWCGREVEHESKYCPNCGAKMKGAKNETN